MSRESMLRRICGTNSPTKPILPATATHIAQSGIITSMTFFFNPAASMPREMAASSPRERRLTLPLSSRKLPIQTSVTIPKPMTASQSACRKPPAIQKASSCERFCISALREAADRKENAQSTARQKDTRYIRMSGIFNSKQKHQKTTEAGTCKCCPEITSRSKQRKHGGDCHKHNRALRDTENGWLCNRITQNSLHHYTAGLRAVLPSVRHSAHAADAHRESADHEAFPDNRTEHAGHHRMEYPSLPPEPIRQCQEATAECRLPLLSESSCAFYFTSRL